MVIHTQHQPEKPTEVLNSSTSAEGEKLDSLLRPQEFRDFVGQKAVVENLLVFCQAAVERGDPLDHTLLYGPPGLGKTTLAMILSAQMKTALRQTSGPALEKPGDIASILTNLQEGDILFIDEIHRLRRPVEEILYTAMEDWAIDLIVGKGPSARTMRLSVPRFTLIGATTKASMLASPLRDRFGHIEKLRYYDAEEIQQILTRSAGILEVPLTQSGAELLAASSRRTPRIANRLLRRMRDFATVLHSGEITRSVVEDSLQKLHIDTLGLDYADQQYLRALCEQFAGGPVGLSTLAAAIGEDESTVEDMIEPYLIREGLLQKTARGRMATPSAFTHLGLPPLHTAGTPQADQPSLLD
ncbi:Holliday junction branch migration DNA helicase RuvB [Candidatus Peribacteria bacterium]|nr:Holliday junction branch migration DNA helicase RuvB [Candidatus Peribacteria bacterium]